MNLENVVGKLVEIGGRQADLLALPGVADCDFIEKANEILIDRGNYECSMKGLIIKSELANLILVHFHTLICNKAKADSLASLPDVNDLENEIIAVVFEQ